jgi:hypothetical protein
MGGECTFLTFEAKKVTEYFKAQFEEGRNVTGTMKTEKNNEAPA